MSLDAALAASFDWRELANMLQSSGYQVDSFLPEKLLEIESHTLMHQKCHSANEAALSIEQLLNTWHQKTIRKFEGMTPEEIRNLSVSLDFSTEENLGGIFWALGSDGRTEIAPYRRFLHEHYQIASIRSLNRRFKINT